MPEHCFTFSLTVEEDKAEGTVTLIPSSLGAGGQVIRGQSFPTHSFQAAVDVVRTWMIDAGVRADEQRALLTSVVVQVQREKETGTGALTSGDRVLVKETGVTWVVP